MQSVEDKLRHNGTSYSVLAKREGFKIHRRWLDLFASEVREKTGKFTVNGHVWEAYWSGILPSLDGDKGLIRYRSRPRERYCVIVENGQRVLTCKSSLWPNLFSYEAIVFPKSEQWAMVFSHEETMHYVEPKI